ncbi:MAG: hypothetical protein ACQEXB_00020 [Bacillota bacterium]
MENKPVHFDGSLQNIGASQTEANVESFVLTDEIRKSLSGNPYTIEKTE